VTFLTSEYNTGGNLPYTGFDLMPVVIGAALLVFLVATILAVRKVR
jgi:hypothetical protein